MAVEQRVVSGQKIGGGKPGGSIGARDKTPEPPPEPPKKSKKMLFVIIGVVVLAAAGAAAFFLLGTGGSGEAAAEAEPTAEPGEVLAIEPISLNLADGHYLRFGITLQLTADAGAEGHGTIDGSKAVDLAIALYSGRELSEVSSSEGRTELKAELLEQVEEAYHGEVMDLYLTNYVTQ